MWAPQAALLLLALLAGTGPPPAGCTLLVPSAQVKWIKAETIPASASPNILQPWKDCVTTCANAGLSSVTAGDMSVYSPLLCGPKAGKELCAVAVTSVNDTPHVPHNVRYLPGTRYTSPQFGLNSCNNVPCWAPLLPVSSAGSADSKPPYKPIDRGYYCGCLPNPLEFWGAWTKGPQAPCPPGYMKTDGSTLNPFNTGFHLGAICRVVKPSAPIPASIDPQGLMGFVRDDKVCVFQFHTPGSLYNGVAQATPVFDRLCVREEMADLPELIV